MRNVLVWTIAAAVSQIPSAIAGFAAENWNRVAGAPIFGVTIPEGYRQWQHIAPSREAEPLSELRAILGNVVAIQAYHANPLPFPDGSILAKIAWEHVQSGESKSTFVPGAPTTVQIMLKDSKRYMSTGGWGFGRFLAGIPADAAQHDTCFACYQGLVRNDDLVFTRLAP